MTNTNRTSFLHINCTPVHKSLWTQAARASNLKLEDWVNKVLAEAVSKMDLPLPAWMNTFSKRTAKALQAGGITKPQQLVGVIQEQSLPHIQNIGPQQIEEIKSWFFEYENRSSAK